MNRPQPYPARASQVPVDDFPEPHGWEEPVPPASAPTPSHPHVEWNHTEFDSWFGRTCPSERCSAFYCLCGLPAEAIRRAVALIMGLHRSCRDGSCSCGCSSWQRCPHVLALRVLVASARDTALTRRSRPPTA